MDIKKLFLMALVASITIILLTQQTTIIFQNLNDSGNVKNQGFLKNYGSLSINMQQKLGARDSCYSISYSKSNSEHISVGSNVKNGSPPIIYNVSYLRPETNQTIVITGYGFGNDPKTIKLKDNSTDTFESNVTPYLKIVDPGEGWPAGEAGWINSSWYWYDLIGVYIIHWNNTKIILGGFGWEYLSNNSTKKFEINLGDLLQFYVYGPNDSGYALYNISDGINVFWGSLANGEPAPMGITDFGLGPNGKPYEYITKSFFAKVTIDSLKVYNSSWPGEAMGFQMNLVFVFNIGYKKFAYWFQEGTYYNTTTGYIYFGTQLWNSTYDYADLYNSTLKGNNGSFEYPPPNVTGVTTYQCIASRNLPGNMINIKPPFEFELIMNVTKAQNGEPEAIFSYNDGHGWVIFDNVYFIFAKNATKYGFEVNGFKYNPTNYMFYDAEFIAAGPYNGAETRDVYSKMYMQLEYWNGHNYQMVPNAYNFGHNTAETMDNVYDIASFQKGSGDIYAMVLNGSGSLKQIYNTSTVSEINLSAPGIQQGSIYVNSVKYDFINGSAMLLLAPGYYNITLVSSNITKNFGYLKLLPGEMLNLSTQTKYNITFLENGLRKGSVWNVTLGGITKSSNASAITFSLPNGTYSFRVGVVEGYSINPSNGTILLNGENEQINISFLLITYNVKFSETGLPNNTLWLVNLSNGQSFSSSTSAITFSEPNGTYGYIITSTDREYHTNGGSFYINGAPVSISVKFSKVTYTVRFSETGLPFNDIWYINISGIISSGPITESSYSINLSNGTYTYSVSTGNKIYSPSYKNTFSVNGSGILESITFSAVTYLISFNETGLPNGTFWYVNITGEESSTEISNSVYSVELTNGTYSYSISTINKKFEPCYNGSFTVNGSPMQIKINFIEVTFTVLVKETGLPSNTLWYLNVSGGKTFSTTNSYLKIQEPNGSYNFTISSVNDDYFPAPYRGIFTISGSNISINITFIPVSYNISFKETGLPPSTLWYVNLSDGQSYSSDSSTISFSEPNGSYSYSISTVNKEYIPINSFGYLTVNGKNLNENVTFKKVTYQVTFKESGLPPGTAWSVTFNGTTESSNSSTITFSVPNGTYSYEVGSINGYTVNPSTGTVNVNGSNISKVITFTLVKSVIQIYNVTFTESGLPAGAIWYVNITGIGSSGLLTGSSFSIFLKNGTYTYTITANGYTAAQSPGTLNVSGQSMVKSITFTPSPVKVTGSSSGISLMELYEIVGAIIIIDAILVGVFLYLRKR